MIICNLEIGTIDNTIFLPDGTQTTVPTSDLGLYVVSFAQSYQDYTIKLVGHPVYADGFLEKIRNEEIKLYGKRLLNIETLGGNNNE